MHREDEDPDRRVERRGPARDLEPVQPRHAHVQQDDVGAESLGEPQRLLAVAGLARDFDALETLQKTPDAGPHERVVIGQQHADRLHAVSGAFSPTAKRARTSVPPPGALRTSNAPPTSATRSCIPSRPIEAPPTAWSRAAAVSNPLPSSRTLSSSPKGRRWRSTHTWRARAWRATLVRASCATREQTVSRSAPGGGRHRSRGAPRHGPCARTRPPTNAAP